MRVGYVGLLKAINNFGSAVGFSLATYAVPCVTGELNRRFRDARGRSWRCSRFGWMSRCAVGSAPVQGGPRSGRERAFSAGV